MYVRHFGFMLDEHDTTPDDEPQAGLRRRPRRVMRAVEVEVGVKKGGWEGDEKAPKRKPSLEKRERKKDKQSPRVGHQRGAGRACAGMKREARRAGPRTDSSAPTKRERGIRAQGRGTIVETRRGDKNREPPPTHGQQHQQRPTRERKKEEADGKEERTLSTSPALHSLEIPEGCLGLDPIACLTSFRAKSHYRLQHLNITGRRKLIQSAYRTDEEDDSESDGQTHSDAD
ncbi:hypothetical protein C8R45DRAFT_920399 [Mycena sanguinolenta]|nr:hypothetical protein C8R45DRAFT_920399 [Mycena sanguinolenta]